VLTTEVTTRLITAIARHFKAQVVDYLLVGFKYMADVLYRLESEGEFGDVRGTPEDFIVATEESHGAMLSEAIRDKDAGAAALLLAELALDQKRKGKTVLDYLEGLYQQFGYYRTEGTSLVMQGIEGKQQMQAMLESLRRQPPASIDDQPVTGFEDLRDEEGKFGPIKGATDAASRNVLLFRLGEYARIALRPSGTEPKAKVYLEVWTPPRGTQSPEQWQASRDRADALAKRLGPAFVQMALGQTGGANK
jgi:phosphoglucomutase/phosphomannomutase